MTAYHHKGRAKLIDVKIGTRLKLIRKSTGMSREDLGRIVEVSYQQIQKYETGANRISATTLHQFARIFNVPMDYFFQYGSEPLNSPIDKNAFALLWEKLPDPHIRLWFYMLISKLTKP